MWVCGKCGCTNEDTNKFCSDCGAPYEEAAETVITPATEEAEEKEIASSSQEGFVNVAAAAAVGEANIAREEEKERREQLMKEAAKEQEEAEKRARKEAEKDRKRAEKQARKDAAKAEKRAEKEAAKMAEKGMVPPPAGGRGPRPDDIPEGGRETNIAQKILGPLSIICGLIGVFSGGYAAIISFLNFTTGLLFFIPSVLAVLFGLICLIIGVRKQTRKVQVLAIIGLILGLLGLVGWVIIMMMLRSQVITQTGGTELMDVLRMLLNR